MPLRLLAIELWPELAGYATEPTEDRMAAALTAATYLHARCEDLVRRGWLARGPADTGPTYAPGRRPSPAPRRSGRRSG